MRPPMYHNHKEPSLLSKFFAICFVTAVMFAIAVSLGLLIELFSDTDSTDDKRAEYHTIRDWKITPEGYRYYLTCIEGQQYIIVNGNYPPTGPIRKCTN